MVSGISEGRMPDWTWLMCSQWGIKVSMLNVILIVYITEEGDSGVYWVTLKKQVAERISSDVPARVLHEFRRCLHCKGLERTNGKINYFLIFVTHSCFLLWRFSACVLKTFKFWGFPFLPYKWIIPKMWVLKCVSVFMYM